MKGNLFNPAVPFSWTREMISGLKANRVRITPAAMCVVLSINCAYKIHGESKNIPLTHKLLSDFCVERHTLYRTLKTFEKAGFLKINVNKGQAIKIDLLLLPQYTSKIDNNRKI